MSCQIQLPMLNVPSRQASPSQMADLKKVQGRPNDQELVNVLMALLASRSWDTACELSGKSQAAAQGESG
jgi:hypothetical protein